MDAALDRRHRVAGENPQVLSCKRRPGFPAARASQVATFSDDGDRGAPGIETDAPWQTHAATESWMSRHEEAIRNVFVTKGSFSLLPPSQSADAARVAAVRHACIVTRTSSSTTRFQNGSNSGSANDREPWYPGTRCRTDGNRLGPPLDNPRVELFDRLVDNGQADDRDGEDAVLVVERPRLVQPLVQ